MLVHEYFYMQLGSKEAEQDKTPLYTIHCEYIKTVHNNCHLLLHMYIIMKDIWLSVNIHCNV